MSSEINQACDSPSMSMLAFRLARLGLTPLDVGGAGDCFFRAISHQLYGTAAYHLHVRAVGIEHLRYHPESFIESNIEYSWLEYLNNMSRQGTWCDNLIIQAVANALNCTIYITESAENFAETNVISPVNMQGRPRTIYIGHLDEIHYFSTAPIENKGLNILQRHQSKTQEETTLPNGKNQACMTQIVSPVNQNFIDTSVTNDALEKRKAFMRQYMKEKRANKEFRESENKRKQKKRKENLEKSRECQRQASKTYKVANPEKVKQMDKQTKAKRRGCNLEKVKECQRRDFQKYKQTNPDKVQLNNKRNKPLVQNLMDTTEKCYDPGQNRKRSNTPRDKNHFQQEATCTKRKRNDFEKTMEKSCHSKESVHILTMSKLIETFRTNIKCGPEYICTSCDQLWYRSSVTKCNPNLYKRCPQNILKLCLTGGKSINNTEWICSTCHSNLKDGKLPSCAKANKMIFPDKPEILNLTVLEERLVSPRIPFMQIRELPTGGQLSIHGNVINVPADVNSTVNVLPRPVNESQTIPIKLKRRLSYKHYYQFQSIRPSKVLEAARYLVQTSKLFQNEGVQVAERWLNTLNENDKEMSQCIKEQNVKSSNTDEGIYENGKNQGKQNMFAEKGNSNDNSESDSDDDWCEEIERPSGIMDTLLQEPDMTEHGEKIISFAPAEGNRPLGIFIDKDSEFLSFPSIFCGKRRADNSERIVPVHYSTICKWELRSQDRRVAQSVPNIFYKLKKLQIKQIQGSASLSLRKCKRKGKKYIAGDLKSAGSWEKLIHLDEGFRVFRNLRGSPPYFERCKKDLFAMIRQLGKPTWFCSFSAAETRWTHLLQMLGRLVDKKTYTDNEIQGMTWQKKSDLIKSDPVTCARNFEHMVQLFLRDILKSALKPIGEIVDFFYRVEFQQRGSPHIHSLFWVKDAPQYGKNSNDDIVKFVDRYVACKADSEKVGDLVNLQRHQHSKTCKKQGHKICRFNFPLPPMPRTMILEPLGENTLNENEKGVVKKNYEKMNDLLNNLKYDDELNFEEFLQKLGFTEQQYIMAVRYSLKRDTLLLKRTPAAIRINSYNSDLLKAWQANMDIQYILDPYACAVYILSYITKGQRGMSKLLRKASEEASSGNKDIINKIRHIGNKFLNAVEISAQEAVYLVLQMPLRRSSREFQFINTSNPEERTFLLKSMDKLQELPDSSEDIESDNLIKRYQRRPKQLEELCLADFVAWYNCVKQQHVQHVGQVKTSTSDDCLPENNFDDNIDDDLTNDETEIHEEYELKGGLKLVKRQKSKIIRSVRFNKEKDPENYSREQLMLYTPWRNENKDLIQNCKSYEERYEQLKNTIAQNRRQYDCHAEVLDDAIENAENDELIEFADVAPNTQHRDEQDQVIGAKPSPLFGCFDPDTNKQHNQYDLMDDIGIFPRTNDSEDLVVQRMNDDDFRKLVRSLNRKQMEFFYHVLKSIKTNDEGLRLFLSGGAGVGKTTVTNALYEALIRYLNSVPGENPDDIKVLKVAPTGKAAFNISGNTLHSAFKIPANRGFEYCTLDRDRLNTIRAQLRKLEVIFIDEISMVGSGMFTFLNLRLQQIMGTPKPFGGINVITVGDLFQLKPVFDKWIFENSGSAYSALATNIWQDHFKMYELSDIMRQKDDKEFAELLNRLREGKHTGQDIEVLKGRILKVKPGENDYPVNITHLFNTNQAVDSHNIKIYNNSINQKVNICAVDILIGDLSDELKERLKEKIPNDPTKTMGLFSVCSVHVAAKYDLTTNVSVLDGMTNGAECTVEKIDCRVADSTRPSIIWVTFQDPKIGHYWRREYSHLYNVQIQSTWTPILEITRQSRLYKRNQVQVLRRQFPLRPAAAKTIHRCQGDTLDEAVVDLPASTREHMHYVGLSRLRNLSSLHILNLNEKKIAVSKKVAAEMSRLRSEASLTPCVSFLYDHESPNNKSNFKILFQNVRSLHLHIQDVACDYSVQAAHVNVFVETALCLRDSDEAYDMPNFCLYRNDFDPPNNTRTPYGTAVYIRNDVERTCDPFRLNYNNTEMTVVIINLPGCNNIHVVGIYRSKSKVVFTKLIEALEHLHRTILKEPQTPVIILGDFNVNFMDTTSEQKALVGYMIKQKGYTQLIKQYTTDYKTQIDHIYTNIPQQVQSSGTLESYYSDHKPIFVCLNVSS